MDLINVVRGCKMEAIKVGLAEAGKERERGGAYSVANMLACCTGVIESTKSYCKRAFCDSRSFLKGRENRAESKTYFGTGQEEEGVVSSRCSSNEEIKEIAFPPFCKPL